MRITRKTKSVLVIAVIGAALVIVGVAIAAFVQDSTADNVSGSTEAFIPAIVTGAQTGTLLPGETADVTLTLTNPNANVKAELLSVTADDVEIVTVVDPEDAAYCHGQIQLSAAGADPLRPTLAVSEANYPYKLTDAVKLMEDTDIRCQAMTFKTTWTVQFQAVR